jgi:hypothetical protein
VGVAAYNRGSRNISRQAEAELAAVQNNQDAKARLWRALLERGCILTFEGAQGAVVTAGPNRTATGTGPAFSLYRDGGAQRWRGAWFGSAWATALLIVEHAGRKRPVRIVERR